MHTVGPNYSNHNNIFILFSTRPRNVAEVDSIWDNVPTTNKHIMPTAGTAHGPAPTLIIQK